MAIVVCAVGCGKKDIRVNVSGTVTINGQPLTRGIVWIQPEGGDIAQAMLNQDGTFTATEVTPGTVTLAVTEDPGANDMAKSKSPGLRTPKIPEKYRSVKTSGLRFTVGSNSEPLKVNLE